MIEYDSLQVVKKYIDALSGLDLDALGRCVSESFVLELPTAPSSIMPKLIEGREAFLEFFGGASAMWSSFRLTHCELHLSATDPSRVFLEYRSEGVNVDGSLYRKTYLSRAIVDDGVVTRYCEMMDPDPLVVALTKLRSYSDSKDVAGRAAG